jgi:hypothetical protein
MELKALCMSCREVKEGETDGRKKPTMQTMKTPKVGNMKKKDGTVMENRYCAQGKCEKCDGNMYKILSKGDAEKMM